MEKRMMKIMCGLVFGGALLWLLPSIGLCEDCRAYVVGGGTFSSIQTAITSGTTPFVSGTTPYATIVVTGTCYENIIINEKQNNITLIVPSNREATITGVDTPGGTLATITILAKGITVRGFTITGPHDVIQVARGGTASIANNTIESTGGYGIVLAFNSYATIVGNAIQNNPRDGIVVVYNSFARIGITGNSDEYPVPNTILGNACGVTVSHSSSAQIVGNTISSNIENGVRVGKVSQADISYNTIDDNGQNGILVEQNSGVNLGKDTGETIFDSPNSSIVGNGAYGLSCDTGGYADGRLGTLDGAGKKAATHFNKSCIDSLIPKHRYQDVEEDDSN